MAALALHAEGGVSVDGQYAYVNSSTCHPGHPSSFENPVGVGSSGPFSSPAVLGSRLHCLFLAASVSGSC